MKLVPYFAICLLLVSACRRSGTQQSTACVAPFIAGIKISNADSTYEKAAFEPYSKGSNFAGTHGYFGNITINNGQVLFDMDANHDWRVTIEPNGKEYYIKDITLEPATKTLDEGQLCVQAFSYTLDDTVHHKDGYITAQSDARNFIIPVY